MLAAILREKAAKRSSQSLDALAPFGSSVQARDFVFGGSNDALCVNSRGIRTYINSSRISFRIRTYESLDLKSFRMRTYKKWYGGGLRSFRPV